MESKLDLNNSVLLKLIENSLFTHRQIEIIYRLNNKQKRLSDISSGAYFREVKQSKSKIYKLIYSIILLELLNIFNHDQLLILNSIVGQLNELQSSHDIYHAKDLESIINVIDEMILRLVKV